MTIVYERQIWCADCRRNHVMKLYSRGVLDEREKARFFLPGDYADQLMKHSACGGCGGNITPHTDIDIVVNKDEWQEICFECFRKRSPCGERVFK